MIRRAFTIASALSLLLFLAAAGMWGRSYWRNDTLWGQKEQWAFNTKEEAKGVPASVLGRYRGMRTARLVAWRERHIEWINSSRGGLAVVWARYAAEAQDGESGWIEVIAVPAVAGSGGSDSRAQWKCSWRDVGYPDWPDGSALLGEVAAAANLGVPQYEASKGRDLRRLIERENMRPKPAPRWGFAWVRWRHEDVEQREKTPGSRVSFRARGLIVPYWFLCVMLLGGPAIVMLSRWRKRRLRCVQWRRCGEVAFGTLAVLCLVLWVTAAVMWVRSYWKRDTFSCVTMVTIFGDEVTPALNSLPPRVLGGRPMKQIAFRRFGQSFLEAAPSGVEWWWSGSEEDYRLGTASVDASAPGMHRRWMWWSLPQNNKGGLSAQLGAGRLLGFEYGLQRLADARQANRMLVRCGVTVPWWALLLALALAPTVMARRIRRKIIRRRRVKRGLCVECGYDLRASKERCPECGSAVPAVPAPKVGP